MPSPKGYSSKEKFISDYMKVRNQEGHTNQKQNAAIAYSVWRNRNKKKKSSTEVKNEILALNQIAEKFDRQGLVVAGRLITKAMKKLASSEVQSLEILKRDIAKAYADSETYGMLPGVSELLRKSYSITVEKQKGIDLSNPFLDDDEL